MYIGIIYPKPYSIYLRGTIFPGSPSTRLTFARLLMLRGNLTETVEGEGEPMNIAESDCKSLWGLGFRV